MQQIPMMGPLRRSTSVLVEGSKRMRGKVERTWIEVMRKDLNILTSEEKMDLEKMKGKEGFM